MFYTRGYSCICETTVTDGAVFTAASLPTRAQLLAQARVGSLPPAAFGAGTYARCVTAACQAVGPEVEVYTRGGLVDERTIFKTTHPLHRGVLYRVNLISTVTVGQYSFRNAPSFHHPMRVMSHAFGGRDSSASEQTAHDEHNALLDMLFHHGNTAPFFAYRLIQRLVTSNPSPRYVNAVADAFRSGSHGSIGTGNYGDLAATVAAALLDREARNPVLDVDKSHGMLKEPMLKV